MAARKSHLLVRDYNRMTLCGKALGDGLENTQIKAAIFLGAFLTLIPHKIYKKILLKGLNLSACADRSTDTKQNRIIGSKLQNFII